MGQELDTHGAAGHLNTEANTLDARRLEERLDDMNAKLDLLVQQRTVKDWYTTAEFSKVVGRAEFTVREWCRNGRIHATKRACGRGPTQEWIIAHEELVRYQNHGLLPVPRTSTRL
jgi:Helix-turn-helix domain